MEIESVDDVLKMQSGGIWLNNASFSTNCCCDLMGSLESDLCLTRNQEQMKACLPQMRIISQSWSETRRSDVFLQVTHYDSSSVKQEKNSDCV